MHNRAMTLYGKNKFLHCLSVQNAEKLSQLIVAIGIVVLIHWFSGPYAAVATRALYDMLFNQYAWYDPRYYLFHVPAREHITYQAFLYGPYVISTLLCPLVYKVIRQTSTLSKKICKYLLTKKRNPHTPFIEEINTKNLEPLLIKCKSDEFLNLFESNTLSEELLPSFQSSDSTQPHTPYYHVHLNAMNEQVADNTRSEETHLMRSPVPL